MNRNYEIFLEFSNGFPVWLIPATAKARLTPRPVRSVGITTRCVSIPTVLGNRFFPEYKYLHQQSHGQGLGREIIFKKQISPVYFKRSTTICIIKHSKIINILFSNRDNDFRLKRIYNFVYRFFLQLVYFYLYISYNKYCHSLSLAVNDE